MSLTLEQHSEAIAVATSNWFETMILGILHVAFFDKSGIEGEEKESYIFSLMKRLDIVLSIQQ